MYFKQNKKGFFCLLKKLKFYHFPDKKIVTNMLNETCDSAEMEKVRYIYLDTMPVCYNKQFLKVEMILTVE